MKYALMEPRPDIGDGIERVAQIVATAEEKFPVAAGLAWEEIPDTVQGHYFRKAGAWGTLKDISPPLSEAEKRASVRQLAKQKIVELGGENGDEGFFRLFLFAFMSRKLHDGGTLSAPEQAIWTDMLLPWFQNGRDIYLAMNALLAMDPIPADFADNSYWP